MLPDCIEATDFRYVKVDDKFLVSLSIKSLPDKIYFLDIVNFIDKKTEYDMSIKYEKLDTTKVINDITYNIANIKSELDSINKNQRNIDIINQSEKDAQNLRKKIQLDNQELYSINIFFTFYSQNLNQINKIISKFKSKFYSKNIRSDITNFRHLEFFLYNLPLNLRSSLANKIYLTTDAVANIFPFYTRNLIDNKGVIFGNSLLDNGLCCIDIFSSKYENSNMCIFGTSGSGKSYFTKLLICRNFFYNRRQIILDCEKEYENLCINLGGILVNKDTYYNIFQINPKDIEEEDFLDKKIDKVIEIIYLLCDTSKIKKEHLRYEICELYSKFNITNDKNSILTYQDENKIYLDSQILSTINFPTLEDLKDNVKNSILKEFLEINIQNKLQFFSKTTNFSLDKNLYVISVDNLHYFSDVLCTILQGILNDFLYKKQTIIYIDEVWKYTVNSKLAECILSFYKTIRKRNGSIVSITQDVTDLFKIQNGLYAKSILNNSAFKMIFKTEYKDEEIFKNLVKEMDNDYLNLKKGEAYLLINRNSIPIKINANKFESRIINEDDSRHK